MEALITASYVKPANRNDSFGFQVQVSSQLPTNVSIYLYIGVSNGSVSVQNETAQEPFIFGENGDIGSFRFRTISSSSSETYYYGVFSFRAMIP